MSHRGQQGLLAVCGFTFTLKLPWTRAVDSACTCGLARPARRGHRPPTSSLRQDRDVGTEWRNLNGLPRNVWTIDACASGPQLDRRDPLPGQDKTTFPTRRRTGLVRGVKRLRGDLTWTAQGMVVADLTSHNRRREASVPKAQHLVSATGPKRSAHRVLVSPLALRRGPSRFSCEGLFRQQHARGRDHATHPRRICGQGRRECLDVLRKGLEPVEDLVPWSCVPGQ